MCRCPNRHCRHLLRLSHKKAGILAMPAPQLLRLFQEIESPLVIDCHLSAGIYFLQRTVYVMAQIRERTPLTARSVSLPHLLYHQQMADAKRGEWRKFQCVGHTADQLAEFGFAGEDVVIARVDLCVVHHAHRFTEEEKA